MTAATPPRTRRALLLIDFQRDFLAGDGRMPVARNQVGPVLAASRGHSGGSSALYRIVTLTPNLVTAGGVY